MRILLLPSVPKDQLWVLHAAGEHPRPSVTEELRRDQDVQTDTIDPATGFLNPFGRMHPFFRAFDPFRILRVLIARRGYDLVVSGNDSAAAALIELRGLFRFRTPIVIWDFAPAIDWRVRRVVQDRIVPKVDGIIALNEIQRPYIARRWSAHVPVIVIGHWVDTDFYQPAPQNPDGPILAVGDDNGRDYQTMSHAIEGLAVPVLIRTGMKLDLDPVKHVSVTVVPRLAPIAFRELYANCRFVVVPLRPDTRNASGISAVLEAGAMGKAVIATESDGIREFVLPGETGLVVPANNPAALRAAIDRLLGDPILTETLGLAARRHVEQTAAPAIFAARLASAYRTLARRRS